MAGAAPAIIIPFLSGASLLYEDGLWTARRAAADGRQDRGPAELRRRRSQGTVRGNSARCMSK